MACWIVKRITSKLCQLVERRFELGTRILLSKNLNSTDFESNWWDSGSGTSVLEAYSLARRHKWYAIATPTANIRWAIVNPGCVCWSMIWRTIEYVHGKRFRGVYGRRDTAAFIALSMPWSNASNVTDFISRVLFSPDNIPGIVVGDVLISWRSKRRLWWWCLDVFAIDFIVGRIMMTCLHEHCPFFPCTVVHTRCVVGSVEFFGDI